MKHDPLPQTPLPQTPGPEPGFYRGLLVALLLSTVLGLVLMMVIS